MSRKSQNWLVVVFSLCTLFQRSSQLFRFCHRGLWHQLRQEDCPYGLLFNEQLQSPCYYTIKSNEEPEMTAPRIWPTLCDEPFFTKPENVSDAVSGDSLFLAQKNGEMRMIQFAKVDNATIKSPNGNDLISMQSCEDRCYRDVFEDPHSSPLYASSSHESSDSLEAPHHITRPKLSSSDVVAVRDQTLRLGDYLFDQIANPEENPGPKLRIVDLFKRSVKIMGKACQHPFITTNFLNRIQYGFLFLVSDSGVGEVEDISVEEYEEIMVALNGCDEKSPDFRLEGTVCETSAIVKEVIKILPNGTEYTAPFQLTQRRAEKSSADKDGDGDGEIRSSSDTRGQGAFPYDELDVFTEAAWSAVQVTHATCFATFKPNTNMHHRFVSAMEQLFSGKIQDRWRNPTRLIDNQMWGTWFLSDVDLTFTNLQACIRAAYLDAPFVLRLDRPIDPVRSPSVLGASQPEENHQGRFEDYLRMSKVKGQSHRKKREAIGEGRPQDPGAYWDEYVANGGIRFRLREQAQCFRNPDERDKVVSFLRDQCKTRK